MRALQVDRQALEEVVVRSWAGRTVIHPVHGVIEIPEQMPQDGVTRQLIRLTVDILAEAIEKKFVVHEDGAG